MSEAIYPLPAFHFRVGWGDSNNTVAFSEATGLTMQSEPIEYRDGADLSLTVRKIPGLRKFGNVTLKRGIVPKESGFFDWWKTVLTSDFKRRDVTISLLNENHDIVMTWEIHAAWPVKVEGPALNAKGAEIAVETLELAHEGMKVTAAA